MADNSGNLKSQTVKFGGEIIKIQTVTIDGVEYLRLEDVQRRFPKVKALCIEDVQQAFVHDQNGCSLEPLRIIANIDKTVEAVESSEDLHSDTHGSLVRIEGKIDRIDLNTQETLHQIRNVMTQMYELDEFTTPRYFFILPAKGSDYALINNVRKWFHAHYKLYFLCECSHEPKEMHIARHNGYSIKNPKEFIKKYAPYLKKTLNIAKLLLSVGSLVIPQLGNAAKIIDLAASSQLSSPERYQNLERQLETVENLLNRVDNQQDPSANPVSSSQNPMRTPLQGAELREVQSYLESVDDKRSLGNLYRIVTVDGHVRWVCLEHYDEVSYNKELDMYVANFEHMGGKFDTKKKEAVLIQLNISDKHVQMMCDTLTKGFNIRKLTFHDCSIAKNDLKQLLDVALNRSSIDCLNMCGLGIRNIFGRIEYVCPYAIAEFNNALLKMRFSLGNSAENIQMLKQFLKQSKLYRKLDISAPDFFRHENDLRLILKSHEYITGLTVQHCRDIDTLSILFGLQNTCMRQLKLVYSLGNPTILSQFITNLKNNETLSEIDLMDPYGFDDENFLSNLLDTLKDHRSIKTLSLHVRKIRHFDNDACLKSSLIQNNLIKRLRISSSNISHEFIDVICNLSKEDSKLTHLEFYQCQADDNDKARLQSFDDSQGFFQILGFYDESCMDATFGEINDYRSRGKLFKKSNLLERIRIICSKI